VRERGRLRKKRNKIEAIMKENHNNNLHGSDVCLGEGFYDMRRGKRGGVGGGKRMGGELGKTEEER
jgi:hypothetical protein